MSQKPQRFSQKTPPFKTRRFPIPPGRVHGKHKPERRPVRPEDWDEDRHPGY